MTEKFHEILGTKDGSWKENSSNINEEEFQDLPSNALAEGSKLRNQVKGAGIESLGGCAGLARRGGTSSQRSLSWSLGPLRRGGGGGEDGLKRFAGGGEGSRRRLGSGLARLGVRGARSGARSRSRSTAGAAGGTTLLFVGGVEGCFTRCAKPRSRPAMASIPRYVYL